MRKIILVCLLMIFNLTVWSQLVVTVIVPPLSSRVAEMFEQSEDIIIICTNPTNSAITFKVTGRLYLDNLQLAKVSFEDSPSETINAMETKTYKLVDLVELAKVLDYNKSFVKSVLRSGYVPAGTLRWCFELFQANDPTASLAAEQCRSMVVTSYQPPIAIAPINQSNISSTTIPIFRWTPVIPSYRGFLNYQVKVFEILPGQDAMQAFRTNLPIWENSTPALQMPWPFEVPRETGDYLWTVNAIDEEGNSVGHYETFAEFNRFSIVSNSNAGSDQVQDAISNGYVRARFFPFGSNVSIYEMILPTKSKEAVRELFENSDQSKRVNVVLDDVPMTSWNDKNIGAAIHDVNGNVQMVLTEDMVVLTFFENPENSYQIGTDAGVNNVFRKYENQVIYSLDRVRRLADNCTGLTGFLVFH